MDNTTTPMDIDNFPFGTWLMERFHPLRFTVVAALLMAAIFNLHPLTLGSANFAKYFIVTFLFSLQFRLLDDLTDIAKDQKLNPHRTMSKLESVSSFWVIYYLLFFFNTMLLWFLKVGDPSYQYFLVFSIFMNVWHKFIKVNLRVAYITTLVKMLKYPVFIYLLIPDYMREFNIAYFKFIHLIVFLAFVIHEITVNSQLRNKIGNNIIILLYLGILAWGTWGIQIYVHTETKVFASIMMGLFGLYFIDFNYKKVMPEGFIVLFTMILLVFFELKGFTPGF